MKCPQTKFHADMSNYEVIRSKKVEIYRWVKIFLQRFFFSLSIFY